MLLTANSPQGCCFFIRITLGDYKFWMSFSHTQENIFKRLRPFYESYMSFFSYKCYYVFFLKLKFFVTTLWQLKISFVEKFIQGAHTGYNSFFLGFSFNTLICHTLQSKGTPKYSVSTTYFLFSHLDFFFQNWFPIVDR